MKLGQTVATPGAVALMDELGVSPLVLLARHASGDWGDLCAEDVQANKHALEHGLRVFSVYNVEGRRFYVITEADRSSTCILLPSEY